MPLGFHKGLEDQNTTTGEYNPTISPSQSPCVDVSIFGGLHYCRCHERLFEPVYNELLTQRGVVSFASSHSWLHVQLVVYSVE